MDKCRLCLKVNKKLRSVFDMEDGVLYIDMITSISNLKINRDEKVTDLCLGCCRKLKEAFDFKNMIEMTNFVFVEESNLRRIDFNSLDEIKIKVEINVKKEIDNKYSGLLKNGFNVDKEFCVNNTIIKKIKPSEKAADNEDRVYNDSDDIESINHKLNYDDDVEDYLHDNSDNSDDEYVPKKYINKKEAINGKENKEAKRQRKSNMVAQKVLIKPVFLEDIGIVRTKVEKKRRKKPKPLKKQQMCNFCGKMTSSMKSHILTHTGKKTHKCDICNKAFYTASLLKYHKQKHEQHRIYKCDQCAAKFNNLGSLKGHMAVHSEEKKYVCQFCNKSFKRRNALQRHEIQHNSANKNVKCDQCNMTFFTKTGLKNHLRVHTGERPFRCEMCSQGYSFKRDFNGHCFKKHGVFIKRRSVYVMNEEVLVKERELMRVLMLRLRGIVQGEDPFKEFEGPQGYMGLEQAIKLLETKQLPIDVHF